MADADFIARHRLKSTAFTRSRKLDFPTLITFLLNLRKGSLQTELDRFFGDLLASGQPRRHVTKSACSQARQQLSYTALTALNQAFVESLYRSRSKALKTWHGFRLCAVDGSQLRLPITPALQKDFGVRSGDADHAKQTMGLFSVYYDVLNHIALDATLEPTTTSERSCLVYHLDVAKERDLILLDRGYNAFWLYAEFVQRQHAFCIRARTARDTVAQAFAASGEREAEVVYTPTIAATRQCADMEIPSNPLTLRLIRVELSSGEVEVLITNLTDTSRYPARQFKRLYHLRWGVETFFRRAKYQQEIEAISGKSVQGVLQDVHATVLAANLTAALALAGRAAIRRQKRADAPGKSKPEFQINFAQAFARMKQFAYRLWVLHSDPLYAYLKELAALLARAYETPRPSRSAPRKMTKFNKRCHHMAYKSTL